MKQFHIKILITEKFIDKSGKRIHPNRRKFCNISKRGYTISDTLKKLKNKIDTTKMKAPAFLMVLIGVGDYAYRRPDGVYVVPIGCLED